MLCLSSNLGCCPLFSIGTDGSDAAQDAPKPVLSISPARGPVLGGTRVTITSQSDDNPDFLANCDVLLGGFLATDVELVDADTVKATIPAQAAGRVDVTVLMTDGSSATEASLFEYVAIGDADAEIITQLETMFPGAPRLVSAISTSNTSVRVTFSEPVRAGADDNTNYNIVIPDGGFLMLNRDNTPTLRDDNTAVDLKTLSQADAIYELTVTGIRDLAGNPIAPPDLLVDPAVTRFVGIAPSDLSQHIDSDGDDFADWFEMLGWEITIELENGQTIQSYVTSDPYNPDTDGDGLTDAEENAHSMDPRTDDTDADLVLDYDELWRYRSNPNDQDTDDDGFADQTEVHFATSLILADADGDQLDDRDEMLNRSRNPRIADLPLPVITVGEMNLEIDERYTYTDEFGREQQTEQSFSDSLQRDTSSSLSNTDSSTARWHIDTTVGLEVGGEWGKGDLGPVSKFHVTGNLQVSGGYAKEDTHATTESSSRSASRTYNEAISKVSSLSSSSGVTRETVGARISSAVTLAAGGDIAFQISDLEISVLQQDPQNRSKMIPIATLVPNDDDAVYSVGPLKSEIGPLIFQNTEIFPNMVEALMKDARGLLFEVANFNITDELDRNFAFSSQEVIERTANITIDFGNGESESYRIATAGQFDLQGNPLGISMAEALRAAGIKPWSGEDPELGSASNPDETRPLPDDPNIAASFGMRTVASVDDNGDPIDVRVITRVRGVQDDFNPGVVETNKPHDGGFWITFATLRDPTDEGNGPALRGAGNFDEIRLHAGQSYIMAFVKDKDLDQLTSLEEFFSGSSDTLADTDRDELSDFMEVRGEWNDDGLGVWRVYTADLPGGYRTYSAPYMKDSDEDGLEDGVEYAMCRYAYNADGSVPDDAYAIETTDGGVVSWNIDPADLPDMFAPSGGLPHNWHENISSSTGGPKQFPSNHAPLDPRKVDTDEDGISDADEVNGYFVDIFDDQITDDITTRVFVYSDPLNADTDGDGLLDGMESLFGTNPVGLDSGTVFDDDLDGLPNRVEETGWVIVINGVERHVFSNPNDPDSDNDNIPDYVEWIAKTSPWYDCDPNDLACFAVIPDPQLTAPGYDTDGDGLSDYDEWDGVVSPQDRDELDYCELIPNCVDWTPNDVSFMTNPTEADTDEDGLNDGDELAGWMVYVLNTGYPVYSDPLNADTDRDGWGDGNEHEYGTDPDNVDTDEDGTYDSIEHQRVASNGDTRDPLVPDQRVTIAFDWFDVTDDGDTGNAICAGQDGAPALIFFEVGAWWLASGPVDYWLKSGHIFSGENHYPGCSSCLDYGECGSSCSSYCGYYGDGAHLIQIDAGTNLWLPGYIQDGGTEKSFIAPYGASFVLQGWLEIWDADYSAETRRYSWNVFEDLQPFNLPIEDSLQLFSATTGPDVDNQDDPVELTFSGRIMVD